MVCIYTKHYLGILIQQDNESTFLCSLANILESSPSGSRSFLNLEQEGNRKSKDSMLGFLLPQLLTCRHTNPSMTISTPMATQTNLPPKRQSRWLYESILLSVADWAREPSWCPSSAPTDAHRPEEGVKVGVLGRDASDSKNEMDFDSCSVCISNNGRSWV